MHAASGLVECVKRLVRKIAVAYVSFGQIDASLQCLVGIADVVMVLVFLFDLTQNLKGLFRSGRLHHDFLKTAFESTVFFDILTIFVKSGGTDALYLAARECRFENVGGIH